MPVRRRRLSPSGNNAALAKRPLSFKFSASAHGLGLLADALLGWLFVLSFRLQLTEYPFTLHSLFEDPKRLIHIVVSNEDLHGFS